MGKSKDPITLATDVFDEFLGKADPESTKGITSKERNAHAKTAGHLGGLKGGHARAAKLTPEERSSIARQAARKRWPKK
jgi:hypothetical protein